MATKVWRPRDLFIDGMRLPGSTGAYSRRDAVKPRSSRRPAIRPEPKKQASGPRGEASTLATGRVTILTRGDTFLRKKAGGDLTIRGTGGLGRNFRSEVYAGAGFFNSPAPSDLPLPSFSRKKAAASPAVEDSATKDLRRLLRLD